MKYLFFTLLFLFHKANIKAQKANLFNDSLLSIAVSLDYKCISSKTKKIIDNCNKIRGAMDDFNVSNIKLSYNCDSTIIILNGRLINYITYDNDTTGLPFANIHIAKKANNKLYNIKFLTSSSKLKIDTITGKVITFEGFFELKFEIKKLEIKNHLYISNYSGQMKELILTVRDSNTGQ